MTARDGLEIVIGHVKGPYGLELKAIVPDLGEVRDYDELEPQTFAGKLLSEYHVRLDEEAARIKASLEADRERRVAQEAAAQAAKEAADARWAATRRRLEQSDDDAADSRWMRRNI